MTSPSAFACGISTQSPMRIMSLDVSCRLATRERIVSRKTSMSTAVSAPRPEMKTIGERSATIETIHTPAVMKRKIFTTCR